MSQPLVSVLIPVYQVEEYIERCARSVFEQTYPNLEYVFVDDGTPDASIDILLRVIDDYPNRKDCIRVIRHEQNKGLAAARNTAVDESRGEFIFHVDADDWIELNAIELLIRRQQETGADIISAEADDYKNGIVSKHLTGGWNLSKKDLLVGILTYNVSTTIWRRLIRRGLYIENAIKCDEGGSQGEDFQILPKLVYYAKTVLGINDCIYHHNLSNKFSYMNNVWNNIDIQIQGIISARTIVHFFSDKEKDLRELVEGLDVKYMHFRMRQNAVNSNKEGYLVFLNYMRKSDPVNWCYVRWNNPLIRYMESNYYSIKTLMKLRRLKSLIKIHNLK